MAGPARAPRRHFNSANMTGAVIASQYVVGRKLGHGAFGHVYSGRSLTLKDDMVAVKVEPRHVRPSLLAYEAKIYRSLRGGRAWRAFRSGSPHRPSAIHRPRRR